MCCAPLHQQCSQIRISFLGDIAAIILEDFLNATCNARVFLGQTGPGSGEISQIANQHGGDVAGPQESML